MRAKFQSLIELIQEEPKRIVYILLFGFVLFWILRSCLPSKRLPNEVVRAIDHTYVTCISPDDTPIQPGVDRQPECGKVYIKMTEEGVVPVPDQAAGVTRAICYRITVEYPRWQTMGQTRHEVLWSSHSYSKVAILQNGKWQTFPDEDKQDEQRWIDFSCPGSYIPE